MEEDKTFTKEKNYTVSNFSTITMTIRRHSSNAFKALLGKNCQLNLNKIMPVNTGLMKTYSDMLGFKNLYPTYSFPEMYVRDVLLQSKKRLKKE